jgi:IclR family acetate operon transcriptional repressor
MKLIQSVERAFDILEFLSDEPEESFSLGEIAAATGLHPATCSHLVGTMVDRGYVEKHGPRKGYQLGAMSHYLIRKKPFGSDLVPQAEPLMAEAAEALGEWVVLTAMAGTRRLVLLELNRSSRAVQLDRQALRLAEQAYDSASIWLFLAHLPSAQRQRFLDCHGFPECCPDAESLERRLTEIREAGHALYQDDDGEVGKVAYPVWRNGDVVAAIGVHLPAFRFAGVHRTQIMDVLQRIANRLGSKRRE